MEEIVIFG